jgi:ribonuclease R
VRPQDKKHRVDLTDVPLVTIDGEDARDFDDAVYCEPAKVGRGGKGWRLLVAIADVSHYVETGSASTWTPTSAPPACTFRAA